MRERIIELARRPEFIPHIYDYCDHWCRLCPATTRCLLYRVEGMRCDGISDTSSPTIEEELAEGVEFATAVWEATGTPIAELDALLADPSRAPRAPALGDPLELLARHYAIQTGVFFEPMGLDLDAEINGQPAPVTILGWYQVMIAAKIYRALVSTDRSRRGVPSLRDDAAGSAKVALIGIERSIRAWQEIARNAEDVRIDALIELLEALRSSVERRFPDARAFMRPGLDTLPGPVAHPRESIRQNIRHAAKSGPSCARPANPAHAKP